MLNINQFRDIIVRPCLHDLLLYSEDAEELLVFTCAVESGGGTYLHQINGRALGIFQMEPVTYSDLWTNFIPQNVSLHIRFVSNFEISRIPFELRLIYDLRYATAMARIFYLRIKEPLPIYSDTEAIWHYYKKYYNTTNGKAEKNDSIKKYHDFVQHYR